MSDFFDRWTGRIANALAIWPLVPAGAIGVVTGYLSTGVGWISQFGMFGWFSAGLAGFLVSSVSLALLGRTRLWRVEAKQRERISGDSTPFNPMAKVHENQRLYLRDLAPGRTQVIDKKFVNCEIIGPGNIVVALRSSDQRPFPMFTGNFIEGVDCIQIEGPTQNAIYFWDCSFEGCKFYHLNLLFYVRHQLPDGWKWITPEPTISQPVPALAPPMKPAAKRKPRNGKAAGP